jgi:hypothetical protein
MLAMQYRFTLPADYDMNIIRRRVAEKGKALDHHAPLAFKVYLVADRLQGEHENRYAPFYLWHQPEGLRDFIGSAGFAGLAQNFGWPVVNTWPCVLAQHQSGEWAQARYATCEQIALEPFCDLANLARDEAQQAEQAIAQQGALLALTVLEPTHWFLLRFRLLATLPPQSVSTDRYEVLHVSCPAGLL